MLVFIFNREDFGIFFQIDTVIPNILRDFNYSSAVEICLIFHHKSTSFAIELHFELPFVFFCSGSGGEDLDPGEECDMRIRKARGCCLKRVVSDEAGAYGKGCVMRSCGSTQECQA